MLAKHIDYKFLPVISITICSKINLIVAPNYKEGSKGVTVVVVSPVRSSGRPRRSRVPEIG